MVPIAAVQVHWRAYTDMGIELETLTKSYSGEVARRKVQICLPILSKALTSPLE